MQLIFNAYLDLSKKPLTVFNIINLLLAPVRSRFLTYEHIIAKRNENFRKAT